MRKNLLQPEVKAEILSRISKLNPQTQRQWGKMNVNQMLYHTAAGLKIAYGEISTAPRGNWLSKQMMRFFILKTDMPTPKEKAETFPEINTVTLGINPADFHVEQQKLIELVKNFPAKQLHHASSLLGKMSKENWARLHYTHLDHHLKQFGV
jgi:hypothetical protein